VGGRKGEKARSVQRGRPQKPTENRTAVGETFFESSHILSAHIALFPLCGCFVFRVSYALSHSPCRCCTPSSSSAPWSAAGNYSWHLQLELPVASRGGPKTQCLIAVAKTSRAQTTTTNRPQSDVKVQIQTICEPQGDNLKI